MPDSTELDALLLPGNDPQTRERPRTVRRAFVGLLACMVVLGILAGGSLLYLQAQLAGQVHRIDNVFAGLENRPARASSGTASKAMNILVMGTDRRSEDPTTGSAASTAEWVPGAQRTDTIMILHVDGDREGGALISIPRDSWVDVPGYGPNKINAAFSLAGPSLAVQTVEDLTGVRIDHLAVIDWTGFEALTDAVGGVTVTVPRTVSDPNNHVVWTRGRQTLDGRQALLYVRQRYGLPQGDLDRVRRQQSIMRGLMRSSLATLRGSNPMSVYDLLDAATRNITVDDEWDFSEMRKLTLDLRGMSPLDVDVLTAPVAGLGMEGAQSVVYLDAAANLTLWDDVRNDRVDRWVSANTDATAAPVR